MSCFTRSTYFLLETTSFLARCRKKRRVPVTTSCYECRLSNRLLQTRSSIFRIFGKDESLQTLGEPKIIFISSSDKLNNSSWSRDISNNFRTHFGNKLQVYNIPERRKSFRELIKQQTFLRSRTPTGRHSRPFEECVNVREVRSPTPERQFEVQARSPRTPNSITRKFAFGKELFGNFRYCG